MRLITLAIPLLLILICAPVIAQEQNDALVAKAAAGELHLVQKAIEYGADVNSVSRNRASLVMAAAMGNHLELLEYLLVEGADPNLATSQSSTPIYAASMVGNADAVEMLLKFNADPNVIMDAYISTPLMSAAVNNRTEVVRLLLNAEAKTGLENNEGLTVLDLVDREWRPEIAALLKEPT